MTRAWPGRATLAGLTALLAACGSVIPGEGAPSAIYALTAPKAAAEGVERVDWQLVVDEPSAAVGLDTSRIAVRPEPISIRYYGDSQWAEPAPEMVRSLIITAFQQSDRIAAVGESSVTLNPDFRLTSELVDFEAVYPDDAEVPEARVGLRATLIEQPGQDVVGSRTFEAAVRAASVEVPDVIEAFDEALNQVLRDLVEWTLTAPAGASATS